MGHPASLIGKHWRLPTLLAFTSLSCGILLGGVSAWFLVSVAIAGLSAASFAFDFHIPAALVRLFAVGRTASRYGERLLGHKAALEDQISRRVGLFASMASAPDIRKAGWQFGDEARLSDYLDDVEDVDYARLRGMLPALTGAGALAVLLVGSAIVAPLSLLPISVTLIAGAVLARQVAKVGASIWKHVRLLRRDGAGRLGAALTSALPLKAEHAWDEECRSAMGILSSADEEVFALRRLQASFDMLTSIIGPLAGCFVIAAAWLAGNRGETLLLPVFLAFAWIAFGEHMNGSSRILVAFLRRDAAAAELANWSENNEALGDPGSKQPALRDLRQGILRRLSPSGSPIGANPLALLLKAGVPTTLVGASGTGKTSLLKQIAGWIGDDVLEAGNGTIAPRERRACTTLVLHDAAVLDDTVRANLFAPRSSDTDMWRALEAVELDDRVRQAGGLDGWVGQDKLSLGEAQRLNLARAWLSSTPVVLLDEPTEHLDAGQGQRILTRLRDHLRARILVMSTHRLELSLGSSVIVLEP